MTEPPPGTWLTCPVCYWTDMALDSAFHRNQLREAQWNYFHLGASLPGYVGSVRAPLPQESRAGDWRLADAITDSQSPRERERGTLIEAIVAAFANASGERRVTLRDAYVADNYAEPKVDWLDDEGTWQDLPSEVLEYFGRNAGVFTFGNAEGFRYYLPAYMIHQLRGGHPSALYALDLKPPADLGPQALDEVIILDEAQRAVAVQFLSFILDFDGPDQTAQRALDKVWRHVP